MNKINPFKVERLSGQVAVVTGGGGGLGNAIARRLMSEGATVAVVDLRKSSATAEFSCFVGDMTIKADVQRVFSQIIDEFHRVNILINNVGGGGSPATSLLELEETHWSGSIANNLTSSFLCTQEFARNCLKNGWAGNVVNIASISGKLGTPLLGPYAVSKAGVIRLTEVFARELAHHGIRVNSVCPSVIDTPLSAKMLERYPETFVRAYDLEVGPEKDARKALEEKVPLGRLGTPHDVAALVAFLVSGEAAYITGQAFNLNGGLITH
ncbi:SDR family NAD(P)-dependent oxidoreductase [Chelativorans sp. Marseille-P2723]|uniref:SDR family NAD(P)-dependent oxidoreductase n=1 Tax=Chelativorans sp. Marseille-P2723 TaxID=2709133 RepID=UPI001570C1D0|nr:SDR family NAD(P)-dependent oxidoreductase [Chelativorans sp. Marseille-P2723]